MSDPRPRRIAPFVALAVAAVVALLVYVFAGASPSSETANSPLLGRPAPAVRGLRVADDDTTVTDRQWQLTRHKGEWLVVNFFDSTCVPCVREHPELVAFAEQQATRPDGVELVSVVWGEYPRQSIAWLREEGATWTVVSDDGSIANAFAVAKVPETWIIDPNGFVQYRIISEVTAEQLTGLIVALTDAPADSAAAGATTGAP